MNITEKQFAQAVNAAVEARTLALRRDLEFYKRIVRDFLPDDMGGWLNGNGNGDNLKPPRPKCGANGNQVLTWDIVRAFRKYASDHPGTAIASCGRRFGIKKSSAHEIYKNQSWCDPDYVPAERV